MSEWQPIETAPKKQWVLVTSAETSDLPQPFERGVLYAVAVQFPMQWPDSYEWVVYGTGWPQNGAHKVVYHKPTHWMPLPEPPK